MNTLPVGMYMSLAPQPCLQGDSGASKDTLDIVIGGVGVIAWVSPQYVEALTCSTSECGCVQKWGF